ncbi:hypothetical protein JOF56_005725 [Kibdelosporangium banguiense]|uniref:Uncharacterized protein n=1 Tax=Kibdelosporangium banguiense TaxID=1365924 RepID=A0ABS4TMZ4_9PSEU|nr:hypothetical protein [Kibdelosporangium banguiense]MBP2325340.1 hypothetical protein [Kibdelosporangium banguiense]
MTSCDILARSASAITGTNPAHDTRFSSSNRTDALDHLCDNLTESAFHHTRLENLRDSHYRRSEGTFTYYTPPRTTIHRWIQAKWLPGTGRYSVTVRRTGAPKPADPLAGQLVLDVRRFINKLFPAALTALNDIMQLTPLNRVPGYTATLENPSRVNLPWTHSDTTGHRLRILYGITELA